MTVAVAVLVLAVVAAPAPAGHQDTLKTEWLNYAASNQHVPANPVGGLFGIGHIHVAISEPCDEAGVGGVKFCETLQPWGENQTHPDRVAINVRDDHGPRVGFYYEFRNSTSGSNLWSGFACGHINELVPHTEQGSGGFPENATELVVRPNLSTSLQLCGSPTIETGTVVVTWRYNATVWDPSNIGGGL